jgi:hypothetical protein
MRKDVEVDKDDPVGKSAISIITVRDLKEVAVEAGYDWEKEVLPRLDEIKEAVRLNTETIIICKLGLISVIGSPQSSKEEWHAGNKRDNIL